LLRRAYKGTDDKIVGAPSVLRTFPKLARGEFATLDIAAQANLRLAS
jgi:hypothetical protein